MTVRRSPVSRIRRPDFLNHPGLGLSPNGPPFAPPANPFCIKLPANGAYSLHGQNPPTRFNKSAGCPVRTKTSKRPHPSPPFPRTMLKAQALAQKKSELTRFSPQDRSVSNLIASRKRLLSAHFCAAFAACARRSSIFFSVSRQRFDLAGRSESSTALRYPPR